MENKYCSQFFFNYSNYTWRKKFSKGIMFLTCNIEFPKKNYNSDLKHSIFLKNYNNFIFERGIFEKNSDFSIEQRIFEEKNCIATWNEKFKKKNTILNVKGEFSNRIMILTWNREDFREKLSLWIELGNLKKNYN